MGRFQQVTRAFGLAACVAFGGGCIHVHRDAEGHLKSVNFKETVEPKAPAGMKPPEVIVDPAVKQASATIPPQATATIASMGKLAGKNDLTRGAASEMALAWQNKVSMQPDVAHNGEMIAGLVGQLFLYAPGLQPATANGKVVIEMFDETGLTGANTKPPRLGGWTLDKESLKKLIIKDEKFGKCYALFLPWPDYKPDVYTRVRLTAKYEPEHGYPLFARASVLTFDNSDNQPIFTSTQHVLGAPVNGVGPIPGGFMGPAATGFAPPPMGSLPPLNPVPIVGRSATGMPSNTAPPPNLPPLVITAGGGK